MNAPLPDDVPNNVRDPQPVLIFALVFAILQAANGLMVELGNVVDALAFYGPPVAAAVGAFLAAVQVAVGTFVRAAVSPISKIRALLGSAAVAKLYNHRTRS